jgi:YggT family protein
MDKLSQVGALMVQFFFYAYILIVVLRFLLQVVRADFYNPLSQFIVSATNPVLIPLRKVVPSLFGIDIASIALAIILQMIALQLLFFVPAHRPDFKMQFVDKRVYIFDTIR